MLLDTYQEQDRYWLITAQGQTSTAGLFAFRGDLVVLAGEFDEVARKRAPPLAVVKQAVVLATADKMQFIAGNFASIDELPQFVEIFQGDLAPDCVPVFYVDNIAASAQVQIGDHRYVLIQFDDGIVWNNLMDEFYVEKGDLKGLSGEDKVLTARPSRQGPRPQVSAADPGAGPGRQDRQPSGDLGGGVRADRPAGIANSVTPVPGSTWESGPGRSASRSGSVSDTTRVLGVGAQVVRRLPEVRLQLLDGLEAVVRHAAARA